MAAAQVGGGAGDASRTTRRCRPLAMEPPPVEVSPQRSRWAAAKLTSVCAGKQGRKLAAAAQAEPYDGWGARCPPATVAGARGARGRWGVEDGLISKRFRRIRVFFAKLEMN